MRPALDRATSHPLRWAALGLVAVVVAACGGATVVTPSPAASVAPSSVAASAAAPSPSPSPSPSPTPVPSKGPATLSASLVGTSGLTGAIVPTEIICGQPSFDGAEIFALAKAGTTGLDIVLYVSANLVEVRVGSGSGATLKLRTFTGTGVTNFGALTGATIDTTLTETTDAGTAKGDLGALSSIKATIDCGDQQAGSTTIVISGETKFGTLAAALTDVHVTCTTTSSGEFRGVQALGSAGGTPVLLFVTIAADRLQVAVETKTVGTFFTATGSGLTTIIPGGASVSGDVKESVTGGATAHVLHVAGDATCGVTVHN